MGGNPQVLTGCPSMQRQRTGRPAVMVEAAIIIRLQSGPLSIPVRVEVFTQCLPGIQQRPAASSRTPHLQRELPAHLPVLRSLCTWRGATVVVVFLSGVLVMASISVLMILLLARWVEVLLPLVLQHQFSNEVPNIVRSTTEYLIPIIRR